MYALRLTKGFAVVVPYNDLLELCSVNHCGLTFSRGLLGQARLLKHPGKRWWRSAKKSAPDLLGSRPPFDLGYHHAPEVGTPCFILSPNNLD